MVIWEGRNNGMHWEDGNPFQRVVDMINQLNADFGLNLSTNDNNAVKIIDLLGWTDADKAVCELKTLVQANVV